MNVRPLNDRIVVRRLEDGEQNVGGIIVPDTAKEKPQRGTVIAAGGGTVRDGGTRVPLDVKPGDVILFGKYTSQEIKLDGEELPRHARGRSAGRHRNRLIKAKVTNGKANRVRRRVAAGNPSRGEQPGQCGQGHPRTARA